PGIVLGHRRLSIIDVAGGHQPLFGARPSTAVVCNGEIYNYRELAAELTALGHTFETRSDTEVAAHAYDQWGLDCLDRLDGMFALALERGQVRTWAYWQIELRPAGEPASFGAAARELRRLLDQAVRSRLVSDVPLGIFLSGGIDSSAIAALAARHGALETFSIG